MTNPYSSDYDECLSRAADEKASNVCPELAYHVEGMGQCDIVLLGFPNWWYTVPMAVHSFLEEYDFSGKTVISFVTYGTGGLAGTIQDMTASLPESAVILESISISRSEMEGAQETVNGWLDGLGFTEAVSSEVQTGEPDSFDSDTGDFCLYAPWGKLSIFYQDFENSSGLISLGRIEKGLDVISARESDFIVSLTKTED